MAKIPVNFPIDIDLLAKLNTYATQTGCTVVDLIEQFCQQGLEIASEGSISAPDVHVDRLKDNLFTPTNAVETDIKNILERLSVLESKVDVDIDVDDYLQNWEKSLDLKIASLVDALVEKRVEEVLEKARRLNESGQPDQLTPGSDTKSDGVSAKDKGLLNEYQIDYDCDDEPDEILTDFLKP